MHRLRDVVENSRGCIFVFCFSMVWCICGVNLAISFFLCLADQDYTLVKAGFVGADRPTVERIAYVSYLMTAYVSTLGLLSTVFVSGRQILPLLFWDMTRLFFTLWSMGQMPLQKEKNPVYFLFLSYAVMLICCITVEMYYSILLKCDHEDSNDMDFVLPNPADSAIHHFGPTSILSTILAGNEIPHTQSGFQNAPPPYSSLADIAPPSYSSLQLSSANISILPAATILHNVQNCSVDAAMSAEDPPPYESLSCIVNPAGSRSCEELQEQENLSFSGHINQPKQKTEPFDHCVLNFVTH